MNSDVLWERISKHEMGSLSKFVNLGHVWTNFLMLCVCKDNLMDSPKRIVLVEAVACIPNNLISQHHQSQGKKKSNFFPYFVVVANLLRNNKGCVLNMEKKLLPLYRTPRHWNSSLNWRSFSFLGETLEHFQDNLLQKMLNISKYSGEMCYITSQMKIKAFWNYKQTFLRKKWVFGFFVPAAM